MGIRKGLLKKNALKLKPKNEIRIKQAKKRRMFVPQMALPKSN